MNAFIALLVIIGFTNTHGQDSKILLVPSFIENQVKDYKIVYSVKASTQGAEQITSTTKKLVSIKVGSIQDEHIDMQWHYGKIEFIDAHQNNPFAVLMNTLSSGITVKYSIDKKGGVKAITNREEITANIQKSIDEKLVAMINDSSIEPSMVPALTFQFKTMFSSPEQIDKIIISDVFKFHELYGKEYSKQHVKIVINQEPSPERYEIGLQSIDQPTHSCLISSKLIDDSSKAIIKEYRYDLINGWLLEHTSRRTSYNPTKVTQYYQIQLLP